MPAAPNPSRGSLSRRADRFARLQGRGIPGKPHRGPQGPPGGVGIAPLQRDGLQNGAGELHDIAVNLGVKAWLAGRIAVIRIVREGFPHLLHLDGQHGIGVWGDSNAVVQLL